MKDIKHTFETIYEKESDAVFRFCLFRVSDREQALDITSEAFLKLWQNLTEGKEDIHNIKAFLFTIVRHLIIDWYRKKKSTLFSSMKNTSYNEEEEMGYDPSDGMTTANLELGAEGRYLMGKINELSKAHQYPVYLRFVEDLSPEEIGKILGISANAVSVRINRGLVELREKVGYNDNINKKDK